MRGKYEAARVLGCGAFGVVLEAWQLNNGRRGVRRAVKLVHSRGRGFTETEARRLEREVRGPRGRERERARRKRERGKRESSREREKRGERGARADPS